MIEYEFIFSSINMACQTIKQVHNPQTREDSNYSKNLEGVDITLLNRKNSFIIDVMDFPLIDIESQNQYINDQ